METIKRAVVLAAMEQLELYEDNLREDYSGRAMYGEECFGIVFDRYSSYSPTALGSELVAAMLESMLLHRDRIEPMEDTEELRRMIRRSRIDSMGTGTIVYFPGIQLED